MLPRLFVDIALAPNSEFELPPGAARHVQVLRLQPGAALTLFNGAGGEWTAQLLAIGRKSVRIRLEAFHAVDRELPIRVTLALGMPANERMDALVEKATELGVVVIQPLLCTRSVLRLSGERAQRRCAHWQAVAQSASEQSGATRLPRVAQVRAIADWLSSLAPLETGRRGEQRLLLSANAPLRLDSTLDAVPVACDWISLSGPEGGLTSDEESAARQRGFTPVSLGSRILRADTAPLALEARHAQHEGCPRAP